MTNSVKLLLTIELEGGTLIRQSKPETINWTLTERDMNRTRIWKGDDGLNIVKRGTAFHHNLVNKECLQRIKLSLTAYLYMISDECPNWSRPQLWKKLKKTERLELHLANYCQHLKGVSFSYEVLDETN